MRDRRAFLVGAGSGAVALAVDGCSRAAWPQAGAPDLPVGFTRLRVVEGTLTVDGKTGLAYRIQQDDGTLGYTGAKGGRFRVALENATRDPLSIHWHGLILPNGQDGVPYVTQPPIKAGEQRLYDFPLVQAGTYWMHSHFGFQEQPMMTAPLILRDPRAASPEEQEVVVMLNDFTTRDAAAILAQLQGQGAVGAKPAMSMPGVSSGTSGVGMPGIGGGTSGTRMSGTGGGAPGTGASSVDMAKGGTAGGSKMRSTKMAMGGRDLNDVKYDAFLANRRPLSDPEVVRVLPGRTVRLRVVNAASATNFFVLTDRLRAEAVAVDGEDIVPFPGTSFELAIAQRIDLRLSIPPGEGAYPIVAQGEGTDMLAGVVLATPGATIPTLRTKARKAAGALSNAQETRLWAVRPLPSRPVDRRLRVTLNGDMARYVWSLNDQVWPNITPLQVKQAERAEIAFVNETAMAHPMHVHGHVFQVTEIDGTKIRGAARDTVLVLPRQTIKVQFDAAYAGYWMIHCHVLYHQAAGMMTVLQYEGFTNDAYNPLASVAEYRR
jgi:FtsP/CotA-like multicopper oxidase with cupredoxin domain